MKAVWGLGVVLLTAGTGGCSLSTSSISDSTGTFGSIAGSVGTPVLAEATPAPPPPPAMGAFLEGPVGTKLGEADRQRAFQAEQDALAAGDRKTWRGVKGNYGFVALNGTETPEGCRAFAHTVYIAGRPQTGKGTGCKGPDGTWRITG